MDANPNSMAAYAGAGLPSSAASPVTSGPPLVDAAQHAAAAVTAPDSASAFLQAYQLCQMLQKVNAAAAMSSVVSAIQQQQQQHGGIAGCHAGNLANCPSAASPGPGSPNPAAIGAQNLQMPSAITMSSSPHLLFRESPPRLTPPTTPPSSADSSISAVIAQLQKASAHLAQPQPTTSLPATLNESQFTTPTKCKVLGAPPSECSSPADSLPPGLKRPKVRVLQSNHVKRQRVEEEFGHMPTPPPQKSPAVLDLVAQLTAASNTPPSSLMKARSSQPLMPQLLHHQALALGIAAEQSRLQSQLAPQPVIVPINFPASQGKLTGMAEPETNDARQMSAAGWTDAEKRELLRLVQQSKPSGAQSWAQIAKLLNESCTGNVNRGQASVERMYRTLTDPNYTRSGNPHGRRLNPRKGSTPMHVMATYSLQQLPDNEGNLTQITDLIVANERFAAELDWTPRPGTKTYPRWKDALVGCFKPGRYPHLVKTDRKREGLNIYKLLKDNLGESQRLQFEQMAAANNLRKQQLAAAIAMQQQALNLQ